MSILCKLGPGLFLEFGRFVSKKLWAFSTQPIAGKCSICVFSIFPDLVRWGRRLRSATLTWGSMGTSCHPGFPAWQLPNPSALPRPRTPGTGRYSTGNTSHSSADKLDVRWPKSHSAGGIWSGRRDMQFAWKSPPGLEIRKIWPQLHSVGSEQYK